MLQEHAKIQADKQETLTVLSKIDLITSSEELYKAINSTDDDTTRKDRKG